MSKYVIVKRNEKIKKYSLDDLPLFVFKESCYGIIVAQVVGGKIYYRFVFDNGCIQDGDFPQDDLNSLIEHLIEQGYKVSKVELTQLETI